MNLADFTTNADLESKGARVPFQDVVFIIAANANPKHQRRMQALVKAHPAHKVRTDVALQENLAVESMADAILLGWEGELKNAGRVLDPKNRADRLEVLKIRAMREWIAEQASNVANFQSTEDAAEVDALKSSD